MKKIIGLCFILTWMLFGCCAPCHNPNIDNRCNASIAFEAGKRDARCCLPANTDFASECCCDKVRVNRAYMRGYHYGTVYRRCGVCGCN